MRLRDWLRRTLRLVPPEFYDDLTARVARIEERLTNHESRAPGPGLVWPPRPASTPVIQLDCGHAHESYSTYRDGTTQCTHCYEAAMALQAPSGE